MRMITCKISKARRTYVGLRFRHSYLILKRETATAAIYQKSFPLDLIKSTFKSKSSQVRKMKMGM